MNLAAQSFNVATSLRRHVDRLCSEEFSGRKAGTEGERKAAAYIFDALEGAGAVMLTDKGGQDFKIINGDDAIASMNIVGIVEGYDETLRGEYIVVGAHMDHMGVNPLTINGRKTTQLYPGADANASGVAMMIELARLVRDNSWMFPRSVIFVGFGAAECGLAGSWYFANRAFEQIGQVKAMVNLDMIGRGDEKNPFQVFSQMAPGDFDYLMARTKEEPVGQAPVFASSVLAASDYLPFYEKKIPVVHFTTGMTREYQTVRDVPSLVLYDRMESGCCFIYHFLKVLASQEEIPAIGSERSGKMGEERVYSPSECDVRPQFFHSDERHFLESWVYKYQKYPKAAVEHNIKGTVLVSFIVEKDGSVTNVQIERGVDELLDDEAIRVISVSPKWIPGQVKGSKVRTRITIPVEFRLAKDSGGFKLRK